MSLDLRERRATLGISLRALADEAGVSQNTIWYLEHGRHEPHYTTLRAVREALERLERKQT